jgi:Ca2+-binding EF-hand superfamily protein
MISCVDTDKNDLINYTEFLTATVTKELYMMSDKLGEAFKAFDRVSILTAGWKWTHNQR